MAIGLYLAQTMFLIYTIFTAKHLKPVIPLMKKWQTKGSSNSLNELKHFNCGVKC